MKTWITADWHLGENRFAIMGRPFEVCGQHIGTLMAKHNDLVSPRDLVYVVGDVVYQNAPQPGIEHFLHRVSQFNGRKILFRGNHDRVFTDEQLAPYFEQIVPEGEGLEIEVGGIPCYITHYPSQGRQDRFNLVGHIHGAWKYQLNSFNVGVDVNHFRPVDLDTIPSHLKAITEFYDEDVWVAYNSINASYRDERGKKSTYLNGPVVSV